MGLESTAFSDFERLAELVQRTHALLDGLVTRGRLGPDGADYLADATLPHLEGVRLGIRAWLRSEMADLAELQYLVRQGGLVAPEPVTAADRAAAVAESMAEARWRGTAEGSLRLRPAESRALTALAHARLVLGLMPRLSDDEVRYRGGRRTYADIPVPRGPAELAGRIEELERQVWRTAAGREPEPLDPAFRRTYGFFDVADRLSRRGLRPH